LKRAKILNDESATKITSALKELSEEIASGKFNYNELDEDVHSAIERGVVAKIGELGGAFRAGRSRNDLVVTDFKLYLIDHLLEVASETVLLATSIESVAATYI